MSTTNTSTDWFKSSFSQSSSNCVQVKFVGSVVLVSDSKYIGPAHLQPIVRVLATAWDVFLELALGNDVREDSIAIPSIATDSHGMTITDAVGTTLEFTPGEWDAFRSGILAGEFSLAAV